MLMWEARLPGGGARAFNPEGMGSTPMLRAKGSPMLKLF